MHWGLYTCPASPAGAEAGAGGLDQPQLVPNPEGQELQLAVLRGQPHTGPWAAPWRAAEILLNEKMAICPKWTRFISGKRS